MTDRTTRAYRACRPAGVGRPRSRRGYSWSQCGLCAAGGRAVLDSAAMWPAALVTAVVLPAALTLWSRLRHDLPGRLRLQGTVLVGRSPLGGHGVDLARVTAVSVGSDPEAGGVVSLRLTVGEEHLWSPWSGLRALPEAPPAPLVRRDAWTGRSAR